MDSLLYDDWQGAFENWPEQHHLVREARLPLIGWLLRKPSDGSSLTQAATGRR